MRAADGSATHVCVSVFLLPQNLLFSRLLTVELQFKLKAINLQTIRHHELPDCYDFTLTVSVGWAGFRSCLEKKSCISIDVSSLVCVHRLCPHPTHTHREALVQLLLWFVVH